MYIYIFREKEREREIKIERERDTYIDIDIYIYNICNICRIYIYIYTDYTDIENIYTYIGVLHMHMFSFPIDNSFTIVTIEEFGNIVSKSLKNDLVLPLKSI